MSALPQDLPAAWPQPYRRYLALRQEEDFAAAVAAAPPEIAGFLQSCRNRDFEVASQIIETLRAGLPEQSEAALTVELAYLDPFAELCETYTSFPVPDQMDALNVGLERCEQAIRISEALEDLPCAALYAAVMAGGFQDAGALPQARASYEEALQIRRELAAAQPQIYRPDVATTLNNLGTVLRALRELPQARASYEEALQIRRELATAQPQIYRPDVATTLNNLGTVLRALRELPQARASYEEALQIRRELAAAQPHIYRPNVATALNNLGNVLGDLRELPQARSSFEEALPIYRELAVSQPQIYRPNVATTLNNLGTVLRALRELPQARASYEEALQIRRELAAAQPHIYRPNVATTLNNLGNVLGNLRELPQARSSFEEALQIYRELATSQPHIYRPDVAMTLNNLGTVLRDLRELPQARASYKEALQIYRELATSQPHIYRPDVAMTLNNLGTVLRDLRELPQARASYEEALQIYRELAASQPQIYRPNVAMTLNNLGAVLRDLRELPQARASYEEALQIYSQENLWIDAALPSANLSRLESQAGNFERATQHAENALDCLDRGMRQLSSVTERDKFKFRYDDIVLALLDAYTSPAVDQRQATNNILRLLEWLRRVDATAELGGTGAASQAETILPFTDPRRALLYTQRAGGFLIFALLRPGQTLQTFKVEFTEQRIDQLNTLESKMYTGSPAAVAATARRAFQILPAEIHQLLTGDDTETVFVSPCSDSMRLPLELIPLTGADGAPTFAGLKKLLVRVHSLAELREALGRATRLEDSACVVIGDPATEKLPRLQHAREGAQRVAAMFGADPLLDGQATRDNVLAAIRNPKLGVLIFSGHGTGGAVALANGEALSYPDLQAIRWEHSPFVHWDCCSAGATWSVGGGRYLGLPPAALRAGAAAVLASFHPLYDRQAKEFGVALYEAVLDSQEPLRLGPALLKARNQMHEVYGTPFYWATSVLWGNPDIRLKK